MSSSIVWGLWVSVGSELWMAWRPAHNERPDNQTHTINLEIPDSPIPAEKHERTLLDIRLRLPVALNVPVGFIQIPYAALSRNKTEWTPTGIRWVPSILWFSEVWRDVTWPIAGMVFWWMLGRAVEALLAAVRHRETKPRIRWIEAILGIAFAVLGTGLCIVLMFDSYSSVGDQVIGVGGGLWAIFGVMIATTTVLQWRLRRRARMQAA